MDVVAAMEPYENLAIAQQAVQLDIRLSVDQLVEVMNKYRHPRHILVPMRAIASTLPDGTVELADAKRTTSTSSTRWSAYKVGESVQLGMGSLYESVLLSEEVNFFVLILVFCCSQKWTLTDILFALDFN